MGVSSIGTRDVVGQVKYALATALVFLGLFYYLYGPPITHELRKAAAERCNELTGETFRTYRLQWRTTTYKSIDWPHWECSDTSKPTEPPTNLGWWVDLG